MRRQIWPQNLVFLTMPQPASVMIHVFPSLEHSTDCVRKPADNFRTFVCVPYGHLWTKHNRAKPMSESASALFSIADAGEFRFARFYIVCEEVPLGTPESPPIVSGVSDMHPSDCPNVEETRNPMQTFSRKKCSHFSPTNIPSAFPHEIPKCILIILLIKAVKDNKQDDVSKELDTWCDTLLLSDDERSVFFMKGYVVAAGYMGYVNGEYMLFSNEDDYREYFED